MKRCAECQFIYEDNDQRCDMDGSELVHDPQWFEERSTSASPPARRGRLLLLFVVNLVLITVLAADYYSFSHRNSPSVVAALAKPKIDSAPAVTSVISENPSAAENTPIDSGPGPVQLDTPAELPSPMLSAPVGEAAKPSEKPGKQKTSESRSSKRASTPHPIAKNTRIESNTARRQKPEDSKVHSMLKKAGHILKKPFKF